MFRDNIPTTKERFRGPLAVTALAISAFALVVGTALLVILSGEPVGAAQVDNAPPVRSAAPHTTTPTPSSSLKPDKPTDSQFAEGNSHCDRIALTWVRPPVGTAGTNLDTVLIHSYRGRARVEGTDPYPLEHEQDSFFGAPHSAGVAWNGVDFDTSYHVQMKLSSQHKDSNFDSDYTSNWSNNITVATEADNRPPPIPGYSNSYDSDDREIDADWNTPDDSCFNDNDGYKVRIGWPTRHRTGFPYGTTWRDLPALESENTTEITIEEDDECEPYSAMGRDAKQQWAAGERPHICFYDTSLLRSDTTFRETINGITYTTRYLRDPIEFYIEVYAYNDRFPDGYWLHVKKGETITID